MFKSSLTGWTTSYVAKFQTIYSSLELYSDNTPTLIYSDIDYEVKFAVKNSTGWHVVSIYNDEAWYIDHKIDGNGNVHVCFMDSMFDNLNYAYYDQNSWTLSNVDMVGNTGHFSKMVVDSNNIPHIVYTDRSNNRLKEEGKG